MGHIPLINDPNDIISIYRSMISAYGKDIFREPRRVVGYFADFAVKCPEEIKYTRIIMDARIPDKLMNCHSVDNQKKEVDSSLKMIIGQGIPEDRAICILEALCEVLGINVSVRPEYGENDQIPYSSSLRHDIHDSINKLDHIRYYLNTQKNYIWKSKPAEVDRLRKLFSNPEKNRDEILDIYHHLAMKMNNDPFDTHILYEKREVNECYSDHLECYFINIEKTPVPIGYAKLFNVNALERILNGWDAKKEKFIEGLSDTKKRVSEIKIDDGSSVSRDKSKYFVIITDIAMLVLFCIFFRKLYSFWNFKSILICLENAHFNPFKMFDSFKPYPEITSYLHLTVWFIISALAAITTVLNVLLLCTSRNKEDVIISNSEEIKRIAIQTINKTIPDTTEEVMKRIRSCGKDESDVIFEKYDFVNDIQNVFQIKPPKKRKKAVTLLDRLLQVVMLIACVIVFLTVNGNIFVKAYHGGRAIMGFEENPEQISSNGFGKGTAVFHEWEENFSETETETEIETEEVVESESELTSESQSEMELETDSKEENESEVELESDNESERETATESKIQQEVVNNESEQSASEVKIDNTLVPKYNWDFRDESLDSMAQKANFAVYGDTEITAIPKEDRPAFLSKALYLDGDGDYIECGTAFNLSDNYTFNILFSCKDVYKDHSTFFAKYETNGEGPYAYSINNGYINCWFTTVDGDDIEVESDTELEENTWYFISIVKEHFNVKIYINGVLDYEQVLDGRVVYNNDTVTIGRQALMFDSDLEFEGYIGDIQIFNSALTDEDVLNEYNRICGK